MGGIYRIPYCTKPGRTLCCMLSGASWATPVPERILSPRSALNPDTQPASGENSGGERRGLFTAVRQGQERKTIAFLTDGNGKGEGKLQISSQATDNYRSRESTNVAWAPPVAWKRGSA